VRFGGDGGSPAGHPGGGSDVMRRPLVAVAFVANFRLFCDRVVLM